MTDTSSKAQAVYFARLAAMSPQERLRIGAALWAAGDSLQRAGLRRLYPEADEAEINFRVAVSRFGEELARRVYGRV